MAVVLGYLVVITQAISRGAALEWPEELWSLGVFLTVVAVFLLQFRNLNRRLANITRLMERGADEGEFSIPYDEEADVRPDAATQVGRAYNRVRAQMSSMVSTDPLTGCINRRGFEQALAREMARATRSGSEFSLLALDLDYFKTVNDTRGHLVGDTVLREVGSVLQQSGRGADIVARTGGEEFSMILPDTDGRGAHLVATRLCEKLRAHSFTGGTHPVRLSVSVGVVTKGIDMPENDVEEMKRRADDALYFAKRSGRDCVRVWTSSLIERRSGGGTGETQRRTRGG
jgi:diguanylate cyclase (GGDEF)-like protein